MGIINNGGGGDHGRLIKQRRHHRRIHETPELPEETDFAFLDKVWEKIKGDGAFAGSFLDRAESVWYKSGPHDIPIVRLNGDFTYLSKISNVVRNLKAINQARVYVPYEKRADAVSLIEGLRKETDNAKPIPMEQIRPHC